MEQKENNESDNIELRSEKMRRVIGDVAPLFATTSIMKSKGAFLFSLFACLMFLAGCGDRHCKAIDRAYVIVNDSPDSALSILNHLDQHELANCEKARYALVYTIAQDKSGLDVSNDSLLRTAYTYYSAKPNDSLYAKCQYYMGKYYMLNDSSEKAIDCFDRSIVAAKNKGDKNTQCLGLEKLSKVMSNSNSREALLYATEAERIYGLLPQKSKINYAYYKLNVCEVLLLSDSLNYAMRKCKEALMMGLTCEDSSLISDTYQVLSIIQREEGKYQDALKSAKNSNDYGQYIENSKLLNLAWAYLNVDSINECKKVLKNFESTEATEVYTKYYLLHLVSLKKHDYVKACTMADSAYMHIDKMYTDELGKKEAYYNSLISNQYEKGRTDGRIKLMYWFFGYITLSGLILIFFILRSYKQYKRKAKLKLVAEEHEQELQKKKYEEEIRRKEIQLSTMRDYIFDKISIADKLDKIRDNREKSVPLSDSDWSEIRMFVDSVECDFVTRLKEKNPELSEDDINFMILLRLRMPSKAMALIYGISEKSIRQKLFVYKHKVGIEDKKDLSLRTFIERF